MMSNEQNMLSMTRSDRNGLRNFQTIYIYKSLKTLFYETEHFKDVYKERFFKSVI